MRVSSLTALVLVAALATSTVLGADPAREYLRGVKAYGSGDWATASSALRNALAADNEEGFQKLRVTGVVFEDYFPWAYLGLSLERLGERSEARAALEESEKQGVVRRRGPLAAEVATALARLRVTPSPESTAPPLADRPAPTATAPAVLPPESKSVAPSPSPVVAPPSVSAGPTSLALPRTQPRPSAATQINSTAVENGIALYFRGRFPEAMATLEPEARSSPMARLFLAFSIAGKAILAETPDHSSVETARREFRRASTEGARATRAHISPRILELLEGVPQPRRTP